MKQKIARIVITLVVASTVFGLYHYSHNTNKNHVAEAKAETTQTTTNTQQTFVTGTIKVSVDK